MTDLFTNNCTNHVHKQTCATLENNLNIQQIQVYTLYTNMSLFTYKYKQGQRHRYSHYVNELH